MQVLTPSGYVDAETLRPGDSVCAFDENTGAPIVNQVETVAYVDLTEWQRWWSNRYSLDGVEYPGGKDFLTPSGGLIEVRKLHDGDVIAEVVDGALVERAIGSIFLLPAPDFNFYKINGTWTLNSEQSIWRNGTNVCHVRDLIVGDTLYDDANNPVPITSIDPIAADGWYRFDISGDHSYIADGLTLHNASRFWVLGTASWTAVNTTNWSASTGGAGGQTVPGSADTVTFDGSSGGGTVTLNFGGTITIQSWTWGAFTGTIENSVNNNNVTMSASSAFSGTGAGTRAFKAGSAIYSLTTTATGNTPFNMATTTGLTWTPGTSTFDLSGVGASGGLRTIAAGSLSYSTLSISAQTNGAATTISGTNTFATLTIGAANSVSIQANQTITNLNINGTSTQQCLIESNALGTQRTLTVTTLSATWTAFRDISASGSASNSFDLGNNTGITITAPSAGDPVAQFISHQRGTPY